MREQVYKKGFSLLPVYLPVPYSNIPYCPLWYFNSGCKMGRFEDTHNSTWDIVGSDSGTSLLFTQWVTVYSFTRIQLMAWLSKKDCLIGSQIVWGKWFAWRWALCYLFNQCKNLLHRDESLMPYIRAITSFDTWMLFFERTMLLSMCPYLITTWLEYFVILPNSTNAKSVFCKRTPINLVLWPPVLQHSPWEYF